jgi:DNA-binding MarR family transcriptional regulator
MTLRNLGDPPLCALSERLIMVPRRLSRLQRDILKCLMAEYRRTQGGTILGHYELVQALRRDKSNVSHSLRTLEARGLIVIHRTPGGQAHTVDLTSDGRNLTSEIE